MCSNEVVGLQTYIGNNCKQPHLYQLFFPWDNFITCGVEEKCKEELCDAICDAIHKDSPKTEVRNTPPVTHDTARDIIDFLSVPTTTTIKTTTTESISTILAANATTAAFATLTELITTVSMTENLSDMSKIKETIPTTPETTINTIVPEPTNKLTGPDQIDHLLKEKQTSPSMPKLKEDNENDKKNSSESAVSTNRRSWAEQEAERRADDKHMDDIIIKRKPQVEAQLAKKPIRISNPAKKKGRRSGSPSIRTFSVFQTVLFGFTISLIMFVI